MLPEKTQKFVIDYAMRFIGLPYIWGGECPMLGYDCSGFVQEILKAIGEDPPGDQTARSLYEILDRKYGSRDSDSRIVPCDILFFGKNAQSIRHVAFAISEDLMIEAGGGNMRTKTKEDAISDKAFIRVRPINSRSNLFAAIEIF